MRIAVWHNLPSGGGKRALYDHISGLVGRGHHVEAWGPPTIDQSYLPLGDIIPEHIVPFDQPGKTSLAEKLQLSLHADRAIAAMDAHCARCAEEIGEGQFDVLLANPCQFYRTTAIGRYASIPSILYLQEPYRWLYEAMPDNRWAAPERGRGRTLAAAKAAFIDLRETRNARVQVREEIRNARAFDLILSNSFFSRESILRAYGVDSEVCYLGIDGSLFGQASAPRQDYVIGLGAFTREKNVELAIRAIGAMAGPRPSLVWVGNVADPAYLDGMKRLAVELGVTFDPRLRVADSELLALLGSAGAMIYAPRLEPFGLAPLEAGACGIPVIAVAEGGVRETVQHEKNGLLAENATPQAVAAALTRLRSDPALAARLGEAGRRGAETFWSKDAATDRLLEKLARYAGNGAAAGPAAAE